MKYRKKPVVIEAVQWKRDNTEELYYFLEREELHSILMPLSGKNYYVDENGFYIKTLEGNMKVRIGDYVIKGIKGEFYPCKAEIFEQTYELAEEEKLVDKETPIKMTKYIPSEMRHWYRCGNCNTTLANRINISHVINTDDINYCSKCGQKINKELE